MKHPTRSFPRLLAELWPALPALLGFAIVAVPDAVAFACAWLIVALIVGLVLGPVLRRRSGSGQSGDLR